MAPVEAEKDDATTCRHSAKEKKRKKHVPLLPTSRSMNSEELHYHERSGLKRNMNA